MKQNYIRSFSFGSIGLLLGLLFHLAQQDSVYPRASFYLWEGHLSGQPELPYSVGRWDKDKSNWQLKNSESIARILAAEYPNWNEHEVRELSDFILQLSQKYHFPPALILSVIDVESRFNPLAVSHKGAVGLMQIKPTTAEYVAGKIQFPFHGSDTLYDPKVNVYLSIQYMRELRDQFKDPEVYLAAYNWGPGAITKFLRNGDPVPSNYYNKVMRSYHKYRSAFVNGT